jgi:hypothetical protein
VDVRGDEEPGPGCGRAAVRILRAGAAQTQGADRPPLARAPDLLEGAEPRVLAHEGVDLGLGGLGRGVGARREVAAQERAERGARVEGEDAEREPAEHDSG